jgi:hypothetical protein
MEIMRITISARVTGGQGPSWDDLVKAIQEAIPSEIKGEQVTITHNQWETEVEADVHGALRAMEIAMADVDDFDPSDRVAAYRSEMAKSHAKRAKGAKQPHIAYDHATMAIDYLTGNR